MDKIKFFIKKWLGIEALERSRIKTDARLDKLFELGKMGIDLGVSEKSDTYIILASKLNGGIVKIIPMRYSSPSEVLEYAKYLQDTYEIREPIKDFLEDGNTNE